MRLKQGLSPLKSEDQRRTTRFQTARCLLVQQGKVLVSRSKMLSCPAALGSAAHPIGTGELNKQQVY